MLVVDVEGYDAKPVVGRHERAGALPVVVQQHEELRLAERVLERARLVRGGGHRLHEHVLVHLVLQRGLGLVGLADVLVRPGHADDRARLVARRDTAPARPDPPVALPDAGGEHELLGVAQGGPDGAVHGRPVRGVHELEEPAVRSGKASRPEVVERAHLRGGRDPVAHQVPLPAADPGDPLGLGEPALAGAEALDDVATVSVLADPVQDRDPLAVGRRQRALADQHPRRRAVATHELDLDLVGIDVTPPHLVQVCSELVAALGVEGVEDGEVPHLGLVDAVHPGDLGVGVDRAALEVEDPDPVG
jgi:hypothetical protein